MKPLAQLLPWSSLDSVLAEAFNRSDGVYQAWNLLVDAQSPLPSNRLDLWFEGTCQVCYPETCWSSQLIPVQITESLSKTANEVYIRCNLMGTKRHVDGAPVVVEFTSQFQEVPPPNPQPVQMIPYLPDHKDTDSGLLSVKLCGGMDRLRKWKALARVEADGDMMHSKGPSDILHSSSVNTSKWSLYAYRTTMSAQVRSTRCDTKVRKARVSCSSTRDNPRRQHSRPSTGQVVHYSGKSGTRRSAKTE